MPSFTRRGRPSFSFASSPPSGRTETAFRVRASLMAGLDYPGPGALPEKDPPPAQAPAHPQAQTPRPPLRARGAGHRVVLVRPARRDRDQDPAARPGQAAADAGEHVRVRREQLHRPGDPPRLAGADRRPLEPDLAVDEARD